MKKLMIAAAIVFAAALSQAASIKWGGDIAQADGTNPVGVGSVAYLIRGTTAAEAAVTAITAVGTDWSAWTTDTGASIVGSHTLTADQAANNYHFEAIYNPTSHVRGKKAGISLELSPRSSLHRRFFRDA